ncbi:RraA family protein [Amycolatopsis thermoflava]|uniref:Putative 4-hydroxy-4-methyl-2-oxoglutarate aldolase n=1 Tax=Amycolatopsis thermoflava TaxID=84480 RepID=A0A3N2H7E7_9PSEU|nr:RraA family protein [Amycolatopsis thermoflava]ROS44359.1 regulator of RNase E activity RraA [Amycolatopsis thermoflava]
MAVPVRVADVAPVPGEVVARYLALPDMTCAVADALDELGVGAVAADVLRAARPGARLCGPAVTLRYEVARHGSPVLADRDLYRLAPPGAVAVIDAGGSEYAVVGEISAGCARDAGVVGVLVEGAVRDFDALTTADALPVWSRARSPRNARGRLDAAELNGPARLGGIAVLPGDLVVADDNGVAAVPADHVTAVLRRCETATDTV